MEELRDIRGLEEISDLSFYLFVGVSIFILLIIGLLVFLFYKHFRAKKESNIRKDVLERLENVNFDNPKEAAYEITKYGRFLVDSPQSEKIFLELEKKLERYKFTKEVSPIDEGTINQYDLFIKMLDG